MKYKRTYQKVSLGEICSFKRGQTITSKNTVDGDIPVVAGGLQPSYYHNVSNRDANTIAVAGSGAYAGYVSYWDKPIYLSDAFSVETDDNAIKKYIYYYLKLNQEKIYTFQKGAGIPHVHGNDIKNLLINLPDVKTQEEIVKVLDSFTNFIDALNEELSLRQKQFEYYREKLLTFDKTSVSVVETSLGEIGNVCMCKRIMTNNEGGIPFYKIGTFGGIADSFISEDKFEEYKNNYNYPKLGDILISASGTIGKTVVFDGKPSYYQDSNIVWIDNDESKIMNSLLKYIYTIIDWKVDDGGVIKRLYNSNIRSTLITYPKDKDIQQSIVEKLDAFESLISSLKEEIALRQKQYEYYREKLLTFD